MEELLAFIAEAKAPHLLTRFPQLKECSIESVMEQVLPVLLKILRKSSKTLPMVTAVLASVNVDLSPLLPLFCEFTNQILDDSTHLEAVSLFQTLVSKSKEQCEALAHFLSKSLSNEKQITQWLAALQYFSANEDLKVYTLKLVPRVKTEAGQMAVLAVLQHYPLDEQLLAYYNKNITSIPHVNRMARLNPPQLQLSYPTNPAARLAALSLQIPGEPTGHVAEYLETDLSIPKTEAEEALAIVRLATEAVKRYPDRMGLYEAIVNGLLGKYQEPRKLLLATPPTLNYSIFETALHKYLSNNESALDRFRGNFKDIVRKFGGAALFRTISLFANDAQKSWIFQWYIGNLPTQFSGSWEQDSLITLKVGVGELFAQFQKYLLAEPFIEIERVEKDLEIIRDLSYIDFAPLMNVFTHFLDFDLKTIDEQAMLTTLKTRTIEKLWDLMRKVRNWLTEKTTILLLTFRETARLLNRFALDKDQFYDNIYTQILPATLGLHQIDSLKEPVSLATLDLFKYSQSFKNLASVMTSAILAHTSQNFREDDVKRAIIACDVSQLTVGETSLLLKLATWNLLNTRLTEISLNCISNILIHKKFSSVNSLISLSIQIMKLGLPIESVLTPLFPLLDLSQFSLLFNTVLKLPHGQKLAYLELIKGYEGEIPNDETVAT